MNIVLFARAVICNSSAVAHALVKENPEKYGPLAQKILSAKNSKVDSLLQKLQSRFTSLNENRKDQEKVDPVNQLQAREVRSSVCSKQIAAFLKQGQNEATKQ